MSTLAFLAARKQNTNKTKQKKARKRAFWNTIQCCQAKKLSAEWAVPWGAVVSWRQRKIAGKIKIQLCFALLCFAFSFLDNVLEGEGGSKEGVECVAFCRGGNCVCPLSK